MSGFNPTEKKAAYSIALLIALRMYGLFLIMPVFSVYAQKFDGATALLIAMALGIYGLTQAVLQIPMGLASDFFGRKKIITLGLLIFIVGSVIAALATDIYGVVIGRAIQGMGAVASTGMALIADVSRPEQRTKMMAFVGMAIGLAFMLAFITGPILSGWFGVAGLFWITAVLATLALVQLHVFVEEPEKKTKKSFSFVDFIHSIKDRRLMTLNVAVFVIHAVMTAVFVVLPLILVDQLNFALPDHWKLYLPVLLVSVVFFVPMIIMHERLKKYFQFIIMALIGLALSQVLLAQLQSNLFIIAAVLVFFFAIFNFLEASMPSMLSRIAGEQYRGAAMGAYSTAQFCGAFTGSIIAGVLMTYGAVFVFYGTAIMVLFSAIFMLFFSKK